MSKITVTGQLTLTGGQLTAKETYVAPVGPSSYTLWTWGNAGSGRLGNNTSTPNTSSPVQVGALTDWASVTFRGGSGLTVKTNGELWTWGYNAKGNVGDGTIINRSSPVQIGILTDCTISRGRLSDQD